MPPDGELTGIVADHNRLAQKTMRLNAAPERALSGDLHRVWGDPQSTDAKAVEMRLPGGLIDKSRLPMGSQLSDDRPGEGPTSHIVDGGVVEHIIGVPGTQQVKKVQPALAASCAEPGEAAVADLRAEAVVAGVPGTGVVDGDPCRPLQASTQHIAALGEEVVLSIDQQAHHLTLRDAEPDGA